MSDHEELEGTVAAWVLGALDANDAESIRVHVEGCATCRQTAARFRRAADSLPLEVEEVVPPARLRERILIAAPAAPSSTVPSAPARKGSKGVLVNMPLKGYSQMAVTAEDGPDGSAAPTQQPQLYGALG